MKDKNRSLDAIEDFLAQKRIAMVGMSRQPKDISVLLSEEMYRRGYDVVPVNPHTKEIGGKPCFASVQEIHPPVQGAILMTTPEVTDNVVRDCAEAGIRRVWMYRGVGNGAVSEQAIRFCEERGIQVIPGECPFMFWQDTGIAHRVHGFIRKITGRYPQHVDASAARAA